MNFSTKEIKYFIFIFLLFLGGFIFIFSQKSNNISQNILFTYPEGDLYFAGEKVPNLEENYYIKERFDKEFLNTSYNLYQLFLYIKRLPLYFPYIEKQLREYNIPDDLKYLAIAESALRNDVISSAGAGGIWQFMPETAKEYGLIVNSEIDERYHFEKSTKAALEYISYLHTLFGDRALVAASYNRGQNAIKSALKNQEVDNYYDLYLNEETSRYVFRILAIKYVLEQYFEHKNYFDSLIGTSYFSPQTTEISVGKIDDLEKWILENGYDYQSTKNLNMWILKNSLPEGSWNIKVLKK